MDRGGRLGKMGMIYLSAPNYENGQVLVYRLAAAPRWWMRACLSRLVGVTAQVVDVAREAWA
jgi:hypothetical protein